MIEAVDPVQVESLWLIDLRDLPAGNENDIQTSTGDRLDFKKKERNRKNRLLQKIRQIKRLTNCFVKRHDNG